MKINDNLKYKLMNILGIIVIVSAFIFMIALTIFESTYYIIAVISTIMFILLLYFDNNSNRQVLWNQIVGAPFAICVALTVRNIIIHIIER